MTVTSFLSLLSHSSVDMPTANRLTIHIIAAMAEHEAEMISARTKAALAAAKARGTLLGSANPKIRTKAVAGLAAAAVASAKQAHQRADELVALIDGIRRAEATTLRSIADALNARGIPTARAGQWHPSSSNALATPIPPDPAPWKALQPVIQGRPKRLVSALLVMPML